MLALRNGHKNVAIDLINAGAKFDEKSRDVCNLHEHYYGPITI